MITEAIYQLFGPRAAEAIGNMLWGTSIFTVLLLIITIVVRIGLLVLVVILLVKAIKYFTNKNKR